MPGRVEILDFTIRTGEGLNRLEIVDEYGFVASTVTISLDGQMVRDEMPELRRISPKERMSAVAVIDTDARSKSIDAILDVSSGQLNVEQPQPDAVSLSGRSVLSLLLDESDTNPRITKSFENKVWSDIVAEVVADRGFGTRFIQSTHVVAEDSAGSRIFNADNLLPGEIINAAVEATGFVANTTPRKDFIFAPSSVPPDYSPITLAFLEEDPDDSDIQSAQFSDGNIGSVIASNSIFVVQPGGEVELFFPLDSDFSGLYFVTRSRYVVDSEGQDFVEYSVARELPRLKAEDEGA